MPPTFKVCPMIPIFSCSKQLNLDFLSFSEESYELVGEAEHIEKDVNDEDMDQDGIEMEASDMDMSKCWCWVAVVSERDETIPCCLFFLIIAGRIFQGASDEAKANLLQGKCRFVCVP